MKKFSAHAGSAVPLRRSNVDTDQIVPAEYLKLVTRTGFKDGLFQQWREDPEFVLNAPQYRGATILLAGPDFGTGSSREHAVWALLDYGFQVVVSSRFADIFRSNAGKSGLLTAQVEQPSLEELWKAVEKQPAAEVTVDLVRREIRLGDLVITFAIDDYTRWRLLEGLDDIDLTLAREDAVGEYESSRLRWLPTIQ